MSNRSAQCAREELAKDAWLYVFPSLKYTIRKVDSLEIVLQQAGVDLAQERVLHHFSQCGGCVTFSYFREVISKSHENPSSRSDRLRKAFERLDLDGDGFLSRDELSRMLTKRGEKMSMADVQKVMDEVDVNHDNRLDFNEFLSLFDETAAKAQQLAHAARQKKEERKNRKLMAKRRAEEEKEQLHQRLEAIRHQHEELRLNSASKEAEMERLRKEMEESLQLEEERKEEERKRQAVEEERQRERDEEVRNLRTLLEEHRRSKEEKKRVKDDEKKTIPLAKEEEEKKMEEAKDERKTDDVQDGDEEELLSTGTVASAHGSGSLGEKADVLLPVVVGKLQEEKSLSASQPDLRPVGAGRLALLPRSVPRTIGPLTTQDFADTQRLLSSSSESSLPQIKLGHAVPHPPTVERQLPPRPRSLSQLTQQETGTQGKKKDGSQEREAKEMKEEETVKDSSAIDEQEQALDLDEQTTNELQHPQGDVLETLGEMKDEQVPPPEDVPAEKSKESERQDTSVDPIEKRTAVKEDSLLAAVDGSSFVDDTSEIEDLVEEAVDDDDQPSLKEEAIASKNQPTSNLTAVDGKEDGKGEPALHEINRGLPNSELSEVGIRGCFYVNEDGKVISPRYTLTLDEETDAWISINHRLDSEVQKSVDVAVLLVQLGLEGRLKSALVSRHRDGKVYIGSKLFPGQYVLVPMSSAYHLQQCAEAQSSGAAAGDGGTEARIVRFLDDDEEFTGDARKVFEELFCRFDTKGSGGIDQDELAAFQESYGEELSDTDWKLVIDNFDMTHAGELSQAGFLALVQASVIEAAENDFEETWKMLDGLGYNRQLELVRVCPFELTVHTVKGEAVLEESETSDEAAHSADSYLLLAANEQGVVKSASIGGGEAADAQSVVFTALNFSGGVVLSVENKTKQQITAKADCSASTGCCLQQDLVISRVTPAGNRTVLIHLVRQDASTPITAKWKVTAIGDPDVDLAVEMEGTCLPDMKEPLWM